MKAHSRVMVFVDGSNMFYMMKRLNLKIDYYKLVAKLVGDRVLIRPYFYSSTAVPPKPAQVRFHQALQHQGFTIVSRPLLARQEGGWVEKGVDLALATDMLVAAFRDLYDTAILVSGDKDYVTVVDEIKRLGKRVEVAAFSFAIANELTATADRYIALDTLQEEIQLQKSQ